MVELFEDKRVIDVEESLKKLAFGDEYSEADEEIYNTFGRRFNANDVIVMEEDFSSNIFLMLRGSAKIVKGIMSDRPKELGKIGEGEIFGEMAFIENRPRSASVVALEDCDLLVFGRDNFEMIFNLHSKWVLRLIESQCIKLYYGYKALISLNSEKSSSTTVGIEDIENTGYFDDDIAVQKSLIARLLGMFIN